MPQALGGLGTVFSGLSSVPGWMKAILGALTGFGEVGNILAGRQRSQISSDLQRREKQFANLTPEQVSSLVARSTQPLSTGLTQSVGNIVQGEVGERGLAESPGIFSAILSQALAPYYQQNQSTALQEVLNQFQLPIQYDEARLAALPGTSDLSPLLALLLGTLMKPGGTGGGPNVGNLPLPPGPTIPLPQPPLPASTTGDTGGDWFSSLNFPGLTGATAGA